MRHKGFDLRSGYLGLTVSFFGAHTILCCRGGFQLYFLGLGPVFGDLFVFDTVSFYLIILSVFLLFSLLPLLGFISSLSKGFVLLRVCCSVLSYCCIHALGF